MNDKVFTVGCDLNGRNVTSTIPDTTEITEIKYIAKVDDNNYIAENLMEVEGQTGNCSVGYYHYLNGDTAETAIFYLHNSGGVVTNLENFTLPSDFGVITEIDDTAVLYDYLTRGCHEKVYVICEDFCKEESLTKTQIEEKVENEVAGYCVPTSSVIGWDDSLPIPEGYVETSETFGGGDGVPLGSEFDYDGETVPDGYTEVEEDGLLTSTASLLINKLKKKNGRVTIQAYIRNNSGSIISNPIATIPEGYRPLYNAMTCGVMNGVPAILSILANGTINIASDLTTNSEIQFIATYDVD